MNIASNKTVCQALFLQAAAEGRGDILFGERWRDALEMALPFVDVAPFPVIYPEFPLMGDPFLDVTILYGILPPGTRFQSKAAEGLDKILDWFSKTAPLQDTEIDMGFELSAATGGLSPAAIHFQHRSNIHLAKEFLEVLQKPEAWPVYKDLIDRMPDTWMPQFFGVFRDRPGSPLRVCGYLEEEEQHRCAGNPSHLMDLFDQVGFNAYDDAMLKQVSAFMQKIPQKSDYQFDLYPDGSLGDTFSIDASISILRSEKLRASFAEGPDGEVLKLLESWGAADDRWTLASGISMTRYLPVQDEKGDDRKFAVVINPKWIKARWRGSILQAAKLYCECRAGIFQ